MGTNDLLAQQKKMEEHLHQKVKRNLFRKFQLRHALVVVFSPKTKDFLIVQA
jgi:hypothetical protein